MRRAAFVVACLIVVSVVALLSFRRSAPARLAVPARERPFETSVRIPERASAKNPLTIVRVTRAVLGTDLQVVGTVTYDRDHYAVIGPLVSGRIVKVHAGLGDRVEAGQGLAVLESAEIGQAQADFLSARARANAADSNSRRERDLSDLHISSVREREVAEAQAASEQASMRAALERLRAYGLSASEIGRLEEGVSSGGRVALRTPISGTVVARSITLGQAVERATDAFVVANLSRLWVLLDLYERDLPLVHVGQGVELRTEAAPGEIFRASIAYVTPLVDERTRTASARVVLQRHDERLRPGQFVTARVLGDASTAVSVLSVPRRAVQTMEGKSVVFRKTADGFEPRSVELGPSHGDRVEVRSGVAENDEIVEGGAFLLKSELSR